MLVLCPQCLSRCTMGPHGECTIMHAVSVPSHCTMGPHGNPWERTDMYYYTCTCSVQSVCPIPLYHGPHGNPWECVLYTCTYSVHPAVPWDHTGILGNVLTCTVGTSVHVRHWSASFLLHNNIKWVLYNFITSCSQFYLCVHWNNKTCNP